MKSGKKVDWDQVMDDVKKKKSQGEKKLEGISDWKFIIDFERELNPEINKIYKEEFSNWSSGKWRERLKTLRER